MFRASDGRIMGGGHDKITKVPAGFAYANDSGKKSRQVADAGTEERLGTEIGGQIRFLITTVKLKLPSTRKLTRLFAV